MLLINNPSKVKSAEIGKSKKKNKHKDSVQQREVENSNDTEQMKSIHVLYLGKTDNNMLFLRGA